MWLEGHQWVWSNPEVVPRVVEPREPKGWGSEKGRGKGSEKGRGKGRGGGDE